RVVFHLRDLFSLVIAFFFSSRRRHTRLVSDWSSDVCSSDLGPRRRSRGSLRVGLEAIREIVAAAHRLAKQDARDRERLLHDAREIGRASWREREEGRRVAETGKRKKQEQEHECEDEKQ